MDRHARSFRRVLLRLLVRVLQRVRPSAGETVVVVAADRQISRREALPDEKARLPLRWHAKSADVFVGYQGAKEDASEEKANDTAPTERDRILQ